MAKATFDLEENIAGLLCYILTWLTGIVFYLVEKENKFVRFHALQSILTFLPLSIIMWIFMGPLGVTYTSGNVYGYSYTVPSGLSVFYYIGALIGLVMVILWLVLMIKAYKGEKFKLPVVGDIAEKHA